MTAENTIYITADADPTLLARVMGVLSTLSIIPSRLSAVRGVDETMSVKMELFGVSERGLDRLQRNLMRLPQCIELKTECKLARVAC